MRFASLLILNVFVVASVQAQFSSHRQVLIFGQPQSNPVKQQVALLEKETGGLRERAMQTVMAHENKELYRKYKVAADAFVLVLVGKDGGEKFRTEKPTNPKELFAIVDTMPMRQSEMRNRKQE